MVVLHVKEAEGFIEKTKGLIGSGEAYPLFFTTRFGIHTFFLKFPIDVVVLDDAQTIVRIREYLQPNNIFLWNPKFQNVIELPAGTVSEKKLGVGEKIEIRSIK